MKKKSDGDSFAQLLLSHFRGDWADAKGWAAAYVDSTPARIGNYEKAMDLARSDPSDKRVNPLLRRASRSGDARAAYALASRAKFGLADTITDRETFDCMLRAADELCHPEASYNVAMMFEFGNGTRKNKKKAFAYYLRASIAGEHDALVQVARCLYEGVGIARDRKLAMQIREISSNPRLRQSN
jgi:uncharacterized protein